MKLYGPDNKELMTVTAIQREGNELVVKGKIFGTMPMTAKLRPAEARRALKLLGLKNAFSRSLCCFAADGADAAMTEFPPEPVLPVAEIAVRLAVALACGAVIGLNRDFHKKPAGFRTFGPTGLCSRPRGRRSITRCFSCPRRSRNSKSC